MSYNILIVDDSSIVRKQVKRTIGMAQIDIGSIWEAENGADALKILGDEWVDLVLLDINMPVMDGMEFMQRLSSDEDLKQTPVVILSTEGSAERLDALKSLGVRAQLRKPAQPIAIVNVIKDLLGGGK